MPAARSPAIRLLTFIATAACALLVAGCASSTLTPAPSANAVPGPGTGARASEGGVTMLRRALPEGVIERDGRASGFVYFQQPNRDARSVEFVVDLVDAGTGERCGTVRIPFVYG